MSVRQITNVWEAQNIQNHAMMMVLLALADWADDEGYCWPSLPKLAAKSRVSERQVKRIVGRLERLGVLQVTHRKGRGHTNHYHLNVSPCPVYTETKGDNMEPVLDAKGDIEDMEKGTPETIKGDIDDIAIRKNRQEPSVKQPSLKPSADAEADPRHVEIREYIKRGFREAAGLDPPPWSVKDGAVLKDFLKANPKWEAKTIKRMVWNRFQSEDEPAGTPAWKWIPILTKYVEAPLTKYGKLPRPNGATVGMNRER